MDEESWRRAVEPGDKPAGGHPLVYPLINRRLRADNDAAAANRARVLMIFARDPRALGRLPFFISLCGNPVRTRTRPSLRERVGHRCTPHRVNVYERQALPSFPSLALSFSLFPFPFRISSLRPRCVYMPSVRNPFLFVYQTTLRLVSSFFVLLQFHHRI